MSDTRPRRRGFRLPSARQGARPTRSAAPTFDPAFPRALSRRTLLRGVLGGAAVAIGLPPLERFMNASGTAYAEDGPGAGGFPTRFGLWFWGNGVLPHRWAPPTEGADWVPSDELQPLAHLVPKVSIVSGVRVNTPNNDPHWATCCGALTGRPIMHPNQGWTFPGPTIDQTIAEAIGQDSRFASLQVGTAPGRTVSWNGPNSENPYETAPLATFERLFGGSFTLPGEDPVVDPTLALRRSVLDAVLADANRMKASVSAYDKARLEAHFDGIRAIEKRLAKLEEEPPNYASCGYPATPLAEYPDVDGRPPLQEINQITSEILAMAFACDQTRVFMNQFSEPVSQELYPQISSAHHQLTHDEPGEQDEVHGITVQIMEALARQIEALDAVEEGDGTLLDHMVLMGTSDVAWGKQHSPEDFPYVLAGSASGKLRTGIHYRSPSSESTSKVNLTVCRALGIPMPSYGEAEGYVEDGVAELEA